MIYRGICLNNIKQVMKKMKNIKAVGLDNIPIKGWKCMGEDGIFWFIKLFNVILRQK